MRSTRDPSPYDDGWEDQPTQSGLHKWGAGLLVPLLLAGYGLRAVVTQDADIGHQVTFTLHGLNASLYGIAWLAVAIFLHCHYFWGNLRNQAFLAVLSKILSATVFIAAMITLLIRNGVLGIH